jgi:hypothetical protein
VGWKSTKNIESLLENAHALTPAVVLGVDKDVVWEGIGVLGGDWRDVVFVLLDDVGDFHDGVAEGSFYSSPGCCCLCATGMSALFKTSTTSEATDLEGCVEKREQRSVSMSPKPSPHLLLQTNPSFAYVLVR